MNKEELVDELDGSVHDLRKEVACIDDALSSAESCETLTDFDANLLEAEDLAEELLKNIQALRKEFLKSYKKHFKVSL